MSEKNKNRQLAELLGELNERLDEVDNAIRPDLPTDDYGIGELSAASLVKLTLAKAGAFLDCLNEASDDPELRRKIGAVAASEVIDLIPDPKVLLDSAKEAGIDLNGIDDLLDRKDDGPDEIDRALASIEGPVI
jgi:hypothetical protein